MIAALKRLFVSPVRQQAHAAYLAIVNQARQPIFYQQWQVEDTLDGRFDMIVLHLFLVMQRCEREEEFCRGLSEIFFADMDRSLREMGVGDTGVGHRIKKMAQAFYGRLKAYGEVADNAALAAALKRNVWREKEVSEEAVTSLADYLRRNQRLLQDQPITDLMPGRIRFSH